MALAFSIRIFIHHGADGLNARDGPYLTLAKRSDHERQDSVKRNELFS